MNFKKIILSGLLIFLGSISTTLFAQEIEPEKDTSFVAEALVDSAFVNQSIFNILPSKAKGDAIDVYVHQSSEIANALRSYISAEGRKAYGYRVRIYFDNKQNSRTVSESELNSFKQQFPGIPAYRSYQNPFFKVTVGDYRTKSEALRLLRNIKGIFPSAFVVKEVINYPLF